ncbi:transcriptional regulator of acetoin/glycerol metabolism [Geodermatophilus tzadiensis]|uniref:Transcriptional regulator of acetoin/glycerol metabolism n=1 Tax=Geodermatophilus tzadiensis TaxID=1137988 RepID=A0A2T0TSP7_9ACTN|nr:helix-turn-helix domain-containing protein [Geodermatophilus tzadiensis]PRY48736.1 transcriptional regulator of acetoin/glycerol metabolism [Geodermatophilus tzadiensis]
MTGFDALTAEGLYRLRRARDEFLAGGLHARTPPGLPAELAAAWRRALFLGVAPDLPAVPRVPGPRHASLVAAASPVLERLADSLSAADLAVVLSDARGRVEVVQAQSPEVRRHLERIDTGPGADLSETTTGLNGISAVVETGRPALVRGPQHVLGLYQDTACAGAPIRDPLDSRLRGVLSLVCGLDVPPVLLSTLVDTAAAAIERELLHHTEPRERVLLDAFLPERARTPAVLALDGRTRIVSDPAGSLLVDPDLADLEDLAATAVRDDRLATTRLRLPGSGHVARLREVLHGGVVAGLLVTLETPDAPPSTPLGIAPGRPVPEALPRLVGSSPAWQALLRRASQLGDARVLVVVGEWGSGRSAVARAVGTRQGRAVTEVEAVDAVTEDPATWLAGVAGALADDAQVVVRGADALPARTAASLRDLAHRCDRGVLALTGGVPQDGRPWYRDLVPAGPAAVVEVPPLRDRGADVPALVAALSAPLVPRGLRLALDAEAALRRWAWPGNVEELRALVARLCREVGEDRPVTSADLPEELRRVTRVFTGLEQAERTAIRAALQASAGNRSRAADTLGIGRTTLYRKLRYYGLDGG